VIVMDITIRPSFLAHDDPAASSGLTATALGVEVSAATVAHGRMRRKLLRGVRN
jgi:hypothetical protein